MAGETAQAAGYEALVSGGSFAGVDQGIDFTGGPFNIYTIGDAVIERVVRGGSGWAGEGGLVTYQITSGPYRGRHVYVAEDIAILGGVKPGLHVSKGVTIARATGSGQAPGIEVGWADAQGRAFGHAVPREPQPMGHDFDAAVRGLSPGGGGGGSLGGAISSTPGAVLGGIGSTLGGAAQHVPGVVQAEAIGSFLGKLSDPNFWLRALQIVAGGVLMLVGLSLLVRQVALAVDLPDPIEVAAKAV